jgi:hypothetical protein
MKVVSRATATALLLGLPLALGACGDSKPEKADVESGFAKLMKEQSATASLPDATVDKIAKCVTGKVYDKVSNETLSAMASGDKGSKGDSDDQKALNDASLACGKEIAAG